MRDDTEPGSDEEEESEGEGKSYGHDRYDPDPPQAVRSYTDKGKKLELKRNIKQLKRFKKKGTVEK